jgi:hypothetical protein
MMRRHVVVAMQKNEFRHARNTQKESPGERSGALIMPMDQTGEMSMMGMAMALGNDYQNSGVTSLKL